MNQTVTLTKNFYRDEFVCPCCGICHITAKLLIALQICRDKFKNPILIASGYRCESYNKKIGGVKGSYHCLGEAADLQTEHFSMASEKLLLEIVCPHFNGVGIYDKHIHVDLGTKRIWTGKSK